MSVTLLLLLLGIAIGAYVVYRWNKNRKRPVA